MCDNSTIGIPVMGRIEGDFFKRECPFECGGSHAGIYGAIGGLVNRVACLEREMAVVMGRVDDIEGKSKKTAENSTERFLARSHIGRSQKS